jgi:NAD-dependent oxidoreductase involved in siderophore biosynthesis
VVWSHAIYVPDYELDDRSASYLHNWSSKRGNRFLSQPTARTIGDSDGPNLADAGMTEFPQIIHRALAELKCRIDGSGVEQGIDDDGLIALSTAWQRCMMHVSPLVERALPPPPVPVPDPVTFRNDRYATDSI